MNFDSSSVTEEGWAYRTTEGEYLAFRLNADLTLRAEPGRLVHANIFPSKHAHSQACANALDPYRADGGIQVVRVTRTTLISVSEEPTPSAAA